MRVPREVLAPLLAALLGIAALTAAAMAGWPGVPNSCIAARDCFCESFREGPIKQPVNTWSALAFAIAGLLIGGMAAAARKRGEPPKGFSPALYAVLVTLVGVGTAFFHASMKRGWGALDYLSMYLLLSYVFAWGALRAARLPPSAFMPLYLLALLPHAAVNLLDWADTPAVFGTLVSLAVAAETAAALRRRDLVRESRWLWATFALFGAGFAVWARSNDSGPLCRPDSLLQGHAVWHILCAAATVTLYRYYASEHAAPATGDPR